MQSIETSDFEIYTNLNQQTVEDKSRLNEIMIYHHLFISYQFINTWLMYYKSSYTSIGPERTLYQPQHAESLHLSVINQLPYHVEGKTWGRNI